MKIKHILSVAALLAGPMAAVHAQTILSDWDFDGTVVAAPDNTVSTSLGVFGGTAVQLGMNNSYTYANGEGPGSSANADVEVLTGASTQSGTVTTSGWRIRGNSNTKNSGAGLANGWNSAAPIGTQGAEFMSDSFGYNNITVTADVNESAQGDRNFTIEYTLDDTAATPIWELATITSAGSQGTLKNNTTSANTITGNYLQLASTGTGWNNQITATLGADANNDANLAIELVNASTGADSVNAAGTALNNSSGNWVFDNIVISSVPVPEPSTLALAGLGGLVTLMGLRKRKA